MEDIMTDEVVTSGGYDISQIYLFLGRCFSYPTKEFFDKMRGAGTLGELGALVDGLPFEVEFKGMPSPSLPRDEFESEYINTFDIGFGPTIPCSLYETAYSRGDMNTRDVYEDLFRFYEHFDIRLSDREKDYPDHLVVELEFMAFLAKKESEAIENGKDPQPYRLAQIDFLERHLKKWVFLLCERLNERIKEPFYQKTGELLRNFVDSHYLFLKTKIK